MREDFRFKKGTDFDTKFNRKKIQQQKEDTARRFVHEKEGRKKGKENTVERRTRTEKIRTEWDEERQKGDKIISSQMYKSSPGISCFEIL